MRWYKEGAAKPAQSLWAGVLIGIGIMAAIDEIIFHQILQWHHFFDQSTHTIGILSDGLLHAAELIVIVAGFFMIADLTRSKALILYRAISGFFLGAGGFQVFDGLITHKVFRIHQVRYNVDNLFLYDLAWNVSGLVLIVIGLWLFYNPSSSLFPADK